MSDIKTKMHQIQGPAGGGYSAPPDSLAGFKGPTSKGTIITLECNCGCFIVINHMHNYIIFVTQGPTVLPKINSRSFQDPVIVPSNM